MTPTSSNRTIYKYILEAASVGQGDYLIAEVDLPGSAQILHVDVQWNALQRCEDLCLWASVDTTSLAAARKRQIAIVPTGGMIPEGALSPKYLGTTLMQSGTYVWHLFLL